LQVKVYICDKDERVRPVEGDHHEAFPLASSETDGRWGDASEPSMDPRAWEGLRTCDRGRTKWCQYKI
jgi:hypothetical protein